RARRSAGRPSAAGHRRGIGSEIKWTLRRESPVGLFAFVRRIDRRRWASKLARRLGPRLLRDYGASKFYTAGQVRAACIKCRLPHRHLPLAYAAFLPRVEFEKTASFAVRADYEALRVLFFRFTRSGDDFSFASNPADFTGGVGIESGGHFADSSAG